jgi:hypothetical protein
MSRAQIPASLEKATRLLSVIIEQLRLSINQFTTFYAFLRLFDTYSVLANYVCAGLIQVNARIRSPG